MQLGMIGLGKMGANMSQRLVRAGHEVVGFDLNPESIDRAHRVGAAGADLSRTLSANSMRPERSG